MSKWQPVMLVTRRRIDCSVCGALAVFVVLDEEQKSDPAAGRPAESDWEYSAWCQECWRLAQEEEEVEA